VKSHVIVWIVIGIVAVVAAVLIFRVLRPPRSGTVTVQGIRRELVRLGREVDKLAAEVTRLRAIPGAAADSLTVAEGLLSSARAQADTIAAAASADEANSRLQRARHELIDAARGILKRVARRLPTAPAPPQ
jgi:type II secretory pathway component PulM